MNKTGIPVNELNITGLSLDSRLVQPGDLFIALPGEKLDGRQFIAAAIEKGAVAVLKASENVEPILSSVLQIPYAHLKETYGYIASAFYDHPSRDLAVIGITGTNGKTSCSQFIAQILSFLGKSCGVIGTLGLGFLPSLQEFDGTTPDAILVQKTLATFKAAGATAVSMEVSSHALSQSRVNGLSFHTAVFTNLSRDHLDYHDTMEAYFEAKKSLFLEQQPKFAVINVDDDHGKVLFQDCLEAPDHEKKIRKLIPYSMESSCPNGVFVKTLSFDEGGFSAVIDTPWGEGEFRCPLLGRFNVSNILASIAVCCLQDIPLKEVLLAVSHLRPVPGRMNLLPKMPNLAAVVIDFAHTPDALTQILKALRPHCQGKLWCVFGCGGERDRGKRPLMAKVAESLSDVVIVTQDNPRTEAIERILNDIMVGFTNPEKIYCENDREKAILYAVEAANNDDIIVLAGKGHETYQILGTEKVPYSDYAAVNQAFERSRRKAS